MRSLVICLLSLLSLSFNAQDYQEMVVEGATWINTYPTAGNIDDYFVYRLNGDTVVNNITYKKLHFQDFEIGDDDILRVLPTGVPYALLREDVEERKVYSILLDEFELFEGIDLQDFEMSRLQGEFENEYLLYDYSLEVGDEIEAEYETSIFRIDTLDRFNYTVLNYLLSPDAEYYERIGNPFTLFHPYQIFYIAGKASAVVHYCGGESPDCEYLTEPLSNNEIYKNELQIFPNPASSYVNFILDGSSLEQIELFASDGRLLQSINVMSSKEIRVDLTDLDYNGVVYVSYKNEFGRYVNRFIKL
ncbi:MAG: T9SS type A sorting domain-containing protein [Bacteroidota bacterium]